MNLLSQKETQAFRAQLSESDMAAERDSPHSQPSNDSILLCVRKRALF